MYCRSILGVLVGIMIPRGLLGYLRLCMLCKSHLKASLSTLLLCLFTTVSLYPSSINEMPAPDAVFVFIKIGYQIFYDGFR